MLPIEGRTSHHLSGGRLRGVAKPQQQQDLALQSEQLEALSLSQAQVQALVEETLCFIRHLEATLRDSVPEEKRAALRQCVQRVGVAANQDAISIAVALIPSAVSSGGSREITVRISPAD